MASRKTLIATLIVVLIVGAFIISGYVGAFRSPASAISSTNSTETVLLLGIGVHIEPLGAQGRNERGYSDQLLFERHVEDIEILAYMVEKYGGKLTVQAQTPFTLVAVQSGESLLANLEARGHEIGLHFHEDAHLGSNPEFLSLETWATAMSNEVAVIKQADVKSVRYWSGGNLYSSVLDAAARAGLDVMSDWKNPRTQETSQLLVGVNPWRPAGGPSASDLTAFATHDPHGKIIYLPDGSYDPEGFAAKRRIVASGGDQAYFDFIRESLERSLGAAQPDRVNVFHFTIHPGEFRGEPSKPYAVVDRFLADVVHPLVETGKIRWAAFSEMADAFVQWEKTHPGVDPRVHQTAQTQLSSQTKTTRVERDVTYCVADGVPLKMDIYYPQAVTGAVPALLYVHGGGWTRGDKAAGAGATEIPEFVKRGYLVAAVNYRLAPQYKFPAQIEDVKCAVRFLRANAPRYGLDPQRIGAWGGSAGGHLVSLLGVTDTTAGLEGSGGYADQSSRVHAVVDMFGPTDLTKDFSGANQQVLQQVFGVTDSKSEALKRASPVTYVSSDDPPFLILHGEKDTLVPVTQSQELYGRLKAADVPATLVIVKNAGHGFAPAGGAISPTRTEITKMVADFFDEHLKQPQKASQQPTFAWN